MNYCFYQKKIFREYKEERISKFKEAKRGCLFIDVWVYEDYEMGHAAIKGGDLNSDKVIFIFHEFGFIDNSNLSKIKKDFAI